MLLLVLAVTGWAVFRHVTSGGLSEEATRAGATEVARGVVGGDPAAFAAAEEQFVRAASVSVVDRYPAFAITATRQVAAARAGDGTVPEIARTIAQGDFERARELAGEGGRDEKARAFWVRYIEAVEETSLE